ncbi:hypothetical protein J4T99_gp046 [Mycobacterium phage Bromden]|uniref:Uncharacterized protein n=1 Tax=Mycobacterium phage Bromden TaxID=2283252 RepID=A0A345MBI1_9CAUD|nr:hypothetical protein J4T99_gp046 [Mycobacterium phage Bromden]AXH67852.1 hypothetical protein SEA_BROMDEN_46 [Mycobacterium phage Bromden]
MTVIYLGEPTGPRLRDLSRSQEKALNDWLTMALVAPPRKREEVPVDFTRALSALAKRRGIRFHFNSDRMRVRGEAVLGKNMPGCVGGSKRKVTVTNERELATKAQPAIRVKARSGGFVTGGGEGVAPYHDRDWRDDYL